MPPKEDRYGRLRAQVYDHTHWLQQEMLRRGLARVDIAPDLVECANELFDAETTARSARAGLWADAAYRVQPADNVEAPAGTFQLVEGTVVSATVRNGQARLEFDDRGGFAAIIAPDDLRTYRDIGVDPRGYAGKTVLVRGILDSGPAIAIANPSQINVIAP
jgi:hypothetical protein